MKADGKSEILHRDDNSSFSYFMCSMGLLGIITKVVLQTVPLFYLEKSIQLKVSFADFSNKIMNAQIGPRDLWFVTLSDKTVVYFTRKEISEAKCQFNCWSGIPQDISSDVAWKAYSLPKDNFSLFKQTEMEYFIPISEYCSVIFEIINTFSEIEKLKLDFPVKILGRYVMQDSIPMSPAYKSDSVAISLIVKHAGATNASSVEYFNTFNHFSHLFEIICVKHNGRPHFGNQNANSHFNISFI